MNKKLLIFFFVTAVTLIYEFISGLYVWLGTEFTISYQFNVLFHIIIGFIFLVPFIFYQYNHFRRATPGWKGGYRITGYISYVVITILVLTGLYLTFVGLKKDNYIMSDIHLWVSIAGAVLILLHFFMKAFKKDWSFVKAFGVSPITCIVLVGGFTAVIFLVQYIAASKYKEPEFQNGIPANYSVKPGDNPFTPSEATTESGEPVDARLIGNSPSCAQGGCHIDIYNQWMSSAHRYSSTDVFYRASEGFLIQTASKEMTRYCAGCHDPVALLSGNLNPGDSLDSQYSHEGSSCIVCHAFSRIKHLKGSGSYVLGLPKRYLFANREGSLAKTMNRILIRTAPALHKAEYSKDFYSTPEFCATCHKQYIKDPNNWGWVKLQDQYGEWLASPFSGRNDKGFNKEDVKYCVDCHMPFEDSDDPAAGSDGKIRSHRFVAANPVIPWLDGDETQFNMTKDWLKGRKLLVTIFPPRDKMASRNQAFIDNEVYQLSEPSPYVTMGEEVQLKVAVTNAKIGHSYPNGPLDIYESWLELKVVDAQNNVIYHTGALDEEGNVKAENTRFFFTVGLNRKGTVINKHNLWHMIGNAYKKLIPSGGTDISTYAFKIPFWAKGDITVMARVRYRKFNKWFTDWVLGGKNIKLPIVDVARDTLSIPIRKQPEREQAIINSRKTISITKYEKE